MLSAFLVSGGDMVYRTVNNPVLEIIMKHDLAHCKYDAYDKKNKSWSCSVAYVDGVKDKPCDLGKLKKMTKNGCFVEKSS